MNEDQHVESQNVGAWLPVADAARRLGVSDKTVRRRIEAGELPSKLETLPRGGVRRVVSLAAPVGQAEPDTSGTNQSAETSALATNEAEGQPSGTNQPDALDTSGTGESALATRLIDAQASEIAFLRAQVEQHARAEAELRAALREALKAAAKALPAPGEDSAPHGAQDAPQQPPEGQPVPTSPALQSGVQRPAQKRRRRRGWLARMFQRED